MRTFLFIFTISVIAATVKEDAMQIEKRFDEVMQFAKDKDKWPYYRRAVFGKDHGCLKAKFVVNPKLPKKYRKLRAFEKDWFPAWVRFANDNIPQSDKELAARGMSIKLVGVAGDKLLDGEKNAVTQDFILENHPTFFVNTATEFREFTLNFKEFIGAHPKTQQILDAMDANILADPLDGTYWIPTPIDFLGKPAKYRTTPCKKAPDPSTKPRSSDKYLRENLVTHLKKSAAAQDRGEKDQEICFNFDVQFQRSEKLEPIEEPMKQWTGDWHRFAEIQIDPHQDIDAEKRTWDCESLSMNIWHTADLTPLGTINEARRYIYKDLGDKRRKQNNDNYRPVPLEEPKELDLRTL